MDYLNLAFCARNTCLGKDTAIISYILSLNWEDFAVQDDLAVDSPGLRSIQVLNTTFPAATWP